MKKLYTVFLVVLTLHSTAQQEANNWFFGSSAGITFNTNPPSFLPGGQINTAEGCASISDSAGNLLFYSDGTTVRTHLHTIMPNGTGLMGGTSSSQSCLIVRQPGSFNLFYVFTSPTYSTGGTLSFNIVDMSLNNGLGDVTVKNMPLGTSAMEKITSALHQNQTDIWIIGHEEGNANFIAFLLSASGINTTPVTSTAFTLPVNTTGDAMGYLKASPNGLHLAAAYNTSNFAELYDFDNSTGMVSNAILLGQNNGLSTYTYGIEFSPDNSKLYVAGYTNDFLIQYNVNAGSAAAIAASADTIFSNEAVTFMALQLAPDGKIYMARYSTSLVGCISNPNAAGVACNFNMGLFPLPSGTCMLGLPNFPPHYFQSIETAIPNPGQKNNFEIIFYPNPATDMLYLQAGENTSNIKRITITDVPGHVIYNASLNNVFSDRITIPITGFSKGIYFLNVMDKNNSVVVKNFVVE